MHWHEIPKIGKERKPANVLTCLLKTHHPGIMEFRGKLVVATSWKHYKAERDTNGHIKAEEVEAGFWHHSIGSTVRVENPNDTLNWIDRGMFGGYVSALGSTDGNYFPLDDDLAPL